MGSDSESSDEDARSKISKNASQTADSEVPPPGEESAPGEEQVTPEGSGKKSRGKKKKREEEGEGEEDVATKRRASPATAFPERSSRERKSVERYAPATLRRTSATKALEIVQGSGEKLKDIPNVAFKLSKRKGDENLHALHRIIFGRKATVQYLKRNILQFSGLVWSQNEDKHLSKVKQKLSKCNKDRLLDFCNLLDIYNVKATTKKEEILAKLLEFLGSPHVTRDVILSEKDKKGRKKIRASGGSGQPALGKTASDKENKRRKKSLPSESGKGSGKHAKSDKEEDEVVSADKDDNSSDEHKNTDKTETSESVKTDSEDKEDEREENESTKKLSDREETDESEEPESEEKSPASGLVSCKKSRKEKAANIMESKYYSRRYAFRKKAEPRSGSCSTNRSATKADVKKGNENISMKDEEPNDEETSEPVKNGAEDENDEHESTKKLSDGEETDEHEEPLFKKKLPAAGSILCPNSRKDSKLSASKIADTGDDKKVTSKPRKPKAAIRKESKDDSKTNALLKKAERRPRSLSSNISTTKDDKKKGKTNGIHTMDEDMEDEGAGDKVATYEAENDEYENEEPELTEKLSNGEETDDVHDEPKFEEKSPASGSISRTKSRKVLNSSAPKKAATGHDTKVTSKSRKEKAAIRKESKVKSKTDASNQNTEPWPHSYSSNRSTTKYDKNKGKIKENIVVNDEGERKKQVAKEKSKVVGKKQGENRNVSVGPSGEQLYAEVARLMQEVDFDVVTLREIVRQLCSHFKVDLMDRKDEIKGMIAEVFQNMPDDEETEDDGEGDNDADEGGRK